MIYPYGGYEIVPLGTFSMYRIKTVGRGSLPKELLGYYTNISLAKEAIDASLRIRGDKNDPAINTSKCK